MVEDRVKLILEKTFKDALSMLRVESSRYFLTFEKMGNMFLTLENAVEIDLTNNIVYINEEWANLAINEMPSDLFFQMAHEARHIYQREEIIKYIGGKKHSEPSDIVKSWIANRKNYKRNVGGNSVLYYQRQPVEVDTNAFAALDGAKNMYN